jgi:hypothetical protein
MTKISETGHAKNVANFEDLTNYVIAFGPAYNPTRESIRHAALQTVLADAKMCMSRYHDALSHYSLMAAERETAFEPVNKLTTRMLNSLKATDTTSNVDDTAHSLARKIRGERATAIKEVVPAVADEGTDPETKHISSAQTSYDSRLDNLDKFVGHLQNIPQYAPNEIELRPASVRIMLEDMKLKNNQAKQAAVALSNARIARDKVLYQPTTGLTDLAFDVKVYIKSLFGATSREYKQVSGIEFKSNK